MGNCCESTTYPEGRQYRDERYKLPKIIVTPQNVGIIYFDVSPTNLSHQFRNSLQHKFPTLISFDGGEKRIINHIELMQERKFYIVIPRQIRQETLISLLKCRKIKAIYFCLEQIHISHIKSSKIKGFFTNQMELTKAIYYDIRSDEFY